MNYELIKQNILSTKIVSCMLINYFDIFDKNSYMGFIDIILIIFFWLPGSTKASKMDCLSNWLR